MSLKIRIKIWSMAQRIAYISDIHTMKLGITLLLSFISFSTQLVAQKMLLFERENDPRTIKRYIGDRLIFRLKGEEDYWYDRRISDILPENNALMLDGYLVPIDDIAALKVYRRPFWRAAGGVLFSFGVSLGVATAGAAIYGDDDENYPLLLGGTASSLASGWWLSKRKKVRLGERYRLRAVEIKFPEPIINTP